MVDIVPGFLSKTAELLPRATPEALGIDSRRLERLYELIESHIAAGKYPGAQIAIARHGQLAALRSFGRARVAPETVNVNDDTLWLLYSQTKMITSATVWIMVDEGRLNFADKISEHLPEFDRNGKGEITIHQLLTHQAGFPNARPGPEVWTDHDLLRKAVCEFSLEWTPGTNVQYHGASAHWTAAVLIEAVTGKDYREVIRQRLLDPLGIKDVFVGVPAEHQDRCADMHVVENGQQVAAPDNNTAAFRAAGVPGGGGYATAAGMQAFYQMLSAGGTLNGVRVLSPRVIQYATRNHTEGRIDSATGLNMNRGLGPSVRGSIAAGAQIRGLGTIAPPRTFGHGGAGSSYSWLDPDSGLSFTYLSNARLEDPFHNGRLDACSSIVHGALVEP